MQGDFDFGLREEIADARGADADEHLDELRPAQREEGDLRFAGDGTRQQRLAGSRRAHQQHALRDAPAERRVFLGVLQELDDLSKLVLGLVHAGHVLEAHLHVIVGVDLRAAAREGHDAAFGPADAAEEEAPHGDQQHERDDPAEDLGQPAADRLAGVLDLVRVEVFDQLRILDARGDEEVRALPALALRVAKLAVDGLVAHRGLDHLAVADERLELAVRDLATGRREEPRLRQRRAAAAARARTRSRRPAAATTGSAGLQVCDRETRVGPYVRRTPARRPCGRRSLRRRRR